MIVNGGLEQIGTARPQVKVSHKSPLSVSTVLPNTVCCVIFCYSFWLLSALFSVLFNHLYTQYPNIDDSEHLIKEFINGQISLLVDSKYNIKHNWLKPNYIEESNLPFWKIQFCELLVIECFVFTICYRTCNKRVLSFPKARRRVVSRHTSCPLSSPN